MKPLTIVVLLTTLLASLNAVAADAPPLNLGGFTLGQPITAFADRVDMNTALPVRYTEAVHEVEIQSIPAFRSGLIAYGTCARPGRILRIKLKYADDSRAFYDALLKRFTDRFGKPTEWAGDPFHVVMDWKWSFTGADGRRVSLHLSHNQLDHEEKVGNAVKMTWTDGIQAEIDCFRREHPRSAKRSQADGPAGPPPWDILIPK